MLDAIPAPYPLFLPFYLQPPNSNVYQYNEPSLAISWSEAPSEIIPIFCESS